jgi:DeoR/GlpR family transcriptional regulator of sugar metabolism/DNA-binding LacI/PurR family transcriptional regulator
MNQAETINSQDKRLQKILFLLKRQGRVSVSELSGYFSVSQVTIRTDLTELERQGLIVRNYGGASLVPEIQAGAEPSRSRFTNGESDSVEGAAMARLAAELVEDGDVLFLDGSTEARALAELLVRHDTLTVVTYSLGVALALFRKPGIIVYLVGGKVSSDGTTLPDNLTNPSGCASWSLPAIHIAKAFIGARGVVESEGFMDRRPEECQLKRELIGKADASFVFLRSSAWGRSSLAAFADLSSVKGIVCDGNAPAGLQDACRRLGVHLIRVDSSIPSEGVYSRFEGLRAAARDDVPYAGSPGKGKRLAFANGRRAEPFCLQLEAGLLAQAALAGFSPADVLVLDNDYNPELAMANARKIIRWGADVVIEFNTDLRSNNQVSELFNTAGIPVVAMDGVIPSSPFVGTNNWRAGCLAGTHALGLIEGKFGSWSAVDAMILVEMESAGEPVLLRTEGFAASVEARFGDEVENKTLRVIGGNQYATARAAMEGLTASLRADGHYIITTVNTEAMQGALDALRAAGIWSPERFVAVTHGDGEMVQIQLETGLIDAAVILHADQYGSAAIPIACAILGGAPVPPYTYTDQAIMVAEEFHKEIAV